MFPDVLLSRNTISEFHQNVGKTCSKITDFMRNRLSKLREDYYLVIDGTLKSDESKVNSLSNFSRKAITKGTRDVSVLYAYNVGPKEPICSKVYPGNMLDVLAFNDFIDSNNIWKGLIVVDKGFSVKAANKAFSENGGPHYLLPLNRDSQIIDHYGMYRFDSSMKGNPQIVCRKQRVIDEKKWLYTFRDAAVAASEEYAYLQKHKDSYDPADHELRKRCSERSCSNRITMIRVT